jgi:hypothetical protein
VKGWSHWSFCYSRRSQLRRLLPLLISHNAVLDTKKTPRHTPAMWKDKVNTADASCNPIDTPIYPALTCTPKGHLGSIRGARSPARQLTDLRNPYRTASQCST